MFDCGNIMVTVPEELGVDEPALRFCREPDEVARFGSDDELALRLAVTESDRLSAWHLVYQEYLDMGYVMPSSFKFRYSIHDALPDTATFLVETQGEVVGTVTVFPDTPVGLPADEIYRNELNLLRRAGRRPVEIGRLTIRKDYANNRLILMNLLDALSLYARCLCQATDLIITVNPSHVRFYERSILFERIGAEKELHSVCGAPAELLRLDLGLEIRVRRWAHGEGPCPDPNIGRHTVYPYLSNLANETERVARMRRTFARSSDAFVHQYFVIMQPLIPKASPMVRQFFSQCYPGLDLAWPAEDAAAV